MKTLNNIRTTVQCISLAMAVGMASGCAHGAEQKSESMSFASQDFKESAKTQCLAFVAKKWEVHDTEFQGEDHEGELLDQTCVLAPTYISEEQKNYWVGGPTYDVALKGFDEDGDPVRHSVSASEDEIVVGTFEMALFPRYQIGATATETEPQWSGKLVVESIGSDDHKISFHVEETK